MGVGDHRADGVVVAKVAAGARNRRGQAAGPGDQALECAESRRRRRNSSTSLPTSGPATSSAPSSTCPPPLASLPYAVQSCYSRTREEETTAGEITIPLLPCRFIDEIADFYQMLGFERSYRQTKPNPCVTLRRDDLVLKFFGRTTSTRRRRTGRVWSWSRTPWRSTKPSPRHARGAWRCWSPASRG